MGKTGGMTWHLKLVFFLFCIIQINAEVDTAFDEYGSCGDIGTDECGALHKTCKDKFWGGYICDDCEEGFVENNTTDVCVIGTCETGGVRICDVLNKTCSNSVGSGYVCGNCKVGYFKVDDSEKCVPETCGNSGKKICDALNRNCKNIAGGGYECTICKYGYVKKDGTDECVFSGPCSRNPCQNNGTCYEDGHFFKCSCIAPYTGEVCQEGPCSRDPCQNNGTCFVDGYSFKCSCKAPYTGEVCQEGPCSRNPCRNNGTCLVDGYSYRCSCKAPYTGEVCQDGPCSENPCLNNGICSVAGYSFKCKCRAPYFGKVCEEECDCGSGFCKIDLNGRKICECGRNQKEYNGKCVDICSPRVCDHGECEVDGDKYSCRCYEGFTGARCDERILFKTKDINILMAVVMFLGFMACFMVGHICFVRRSHGCDK